MRLGSGMMARYEQNQLMDDNHHQAGESIQAPTQPHVSLSSGSITTNHIARTARHLRAGERWRSELHGAFAPQEIDYFEITYDLFHAGFLGGLEVGLPFRVFIASLLG